MTIIQAIHFPADNLVCTRDHARTRFTFSEEMARFFDAHHLYTLTHAKKQHRLVKGTGWFEVGNHAVIEPFTSFLSGSYLCSMGAFSMTSSALPINTIVGRYTSIATGIYRLGGNHPTDRFTTSMLTYSRSVSAFEDYLQEKDQSFKTAGVDIPNYAPMVIGNDVWIGQDVKFVATGISVGNGAVIGAGSLVTKDVPSYAIVGGVPAKVIRYRFSPEIIAALEELQWWNYAYPDFQGIDGGTDIETFVEKVSSQVKQGQIEPFQPKALNLESFKEV
ncbi:CatB-related O-acetyltransferase [Listeria seeligeri]|uniref:CatB-related O-acetyltransferase n=1 Tax=Listeria seeligeri TaxID=1640 RepID=UPI001626858A|nr:CatB-related O-acetyltransferase [Listeria seeligeri]MBC1734146.1 CatB-related O-acetyltransferase [Listeria seeligeri]